MDNTLMKKLSTGSILESAVYGSKKIENYSKKGSIIESKVFGERKKKNISWFGICGRK